MLTLLFALINTPINTQKKIVWDIIKILDLCQDWPVLTYRTIIEVDAVCDLHCEVVDALLLPVEGTSHN